jgi:hypothetical protein
MIKVKITDEFFTVFTLECETVSEASRIVSEWLEASESGETPIYEILVELNPSV